MYVNAVPVVFGIVDDDIAIFPESREVKVALGRSRRDHGQGAQPRRRVGNEAAAVHLDFGLRPLGLRRGFDFPRHACESFDLLLEGGLARV